MTTNRGPGIYADQGGTDWVLVNAAFVTAGGAIKGAPGRLCNITILSSPTSAAAVFNDCAAASGAASANEFYAIAQNTTAGGPPIDLEWPCNVGIVCSAAGGGTFAVSFS